MSGARRPPDSGQLSHGHLLGPHVVGQRVVVRRLLRGETGPTGGPAFTDLLGTCLAWDDDGCVVQPEDGPTVTIALADIVSGKPVPPRPATRLRVSVRDAEAHTATLWPDVEQVALGEWQLRHHPRHRAKRANSCLAIGDPGRPVADALTEVAAFHRARGRTPLVQVEAGSAVEDAVRAAGWTPLPHGEATFCLASVARVRRDLARRGGTPRGELSLDASGHRAVASIGTGCDPVAEAQAAVDGDWLGLHGVSVAAGHRRRGLARWLVAELLEWGAERGALTAWLHVETDNPDGVAFWEALGFTPHHPLPPAVRPRRHSPASVVSASPVSR